MSSIALTSSVAASSGLEESHSIDRRRFAGVGLATVVAAVLANVFVYYLGDAIIGYDPDFVVLSNVSGVALFTLIGAVGAVLVYAGLLRYSSNPVRVFSGISAVVFVVTTIPDFVLIPSEEGASNGQTAILVLTHIVAAVVIVKMLTTYARPQPR